MSVIPENSSTNELYAQVSLKMEQASCSWKLIFSSADGLNELSFTINVEVPAAPTKVVFDPQNTELHYSVGEQIEVMFDFANWIMTGESFFQKMVGGEWTLVTDPNALDENDCAKFIAYNAETFSNIYEVMRECQIKLVATSVSDSTQVEWILNFSPSSECDECPIGMAPTSTTDCTCVAIETPPAAGQLFQAHEFASGTSHVVDLKVGDMVTFLQFAVKGEFMYANNNLD